jgi:hypothetical protein
MADGSPAENHSEPSPWSRPAVLVSGGFLLILVLAGILVAVAGGGHQADHSAQRQSAIPQPSTTSSAAPANPETCTLSAGPQSIPSASPPAGTQWASVGSMQAPQASRLYGPQRTAGGFGTCFARSPAGALLAAINLWAESTAAPPSQVFAKLAVGAPPRLGNNARMDAGGSVQLAGYRYESYSPARAQVSIVLRGPEGKLAAAITTMVWAVGDWKYLFPPNGTPPVQVISDLTGYVTWSAF